MVIARVVCILSGSDLSPVDFASVCGFGEQVFLPMPPGPLRLLCHTSFSGWPPGLCPPLTDQQVARTPTGTLPEGQAAPPTHPHVTGCHLSPFTRPPPSANCSFLPLWLAPPLSSEACVPRIPRTSTWPSLSLTLQPGHAALLVSSPCLAGKTPCLLPPPVISPAPHSHLIGCSHPSEWPSTALPA